MKHKKIFLFIIIIVAIFTNTTSFATTNQVTFENQYTENAEYAENIENLYCESCVLIECSKQKIAYTKNADKQLFPASTTKLLTAIITVQKCNLTDNVTITSNMISNIPAGYTIAYLQQGENYTIEQLLNLLLIPSANDAGYALAMHISGSIDNFSKLMNETASSLGCTNSNFTNPSGIHNENHYSTAKDMAIIGMNSLNYPIIPEICSKTSYTINNRVFNSTNTLLQNNLPNYYKYATGLKTGFTEPAGSCIVATAEKNNMKFLAVVFNCPKPTSEIVYRDADCKTLFEYGFEHYNEITFEAPHPLKLIFTNYFNAINLKLIFGFLFIVLFLLDFFLVLKFTIKQEL